MLFVNFPAANSSFICRIVKTSRLSCYFLLQFKHEKESSKNEKGVPLC